MKKYLATLLISLSLVAPISAQVSDSTTQIRTAFAKETITVSTVAIGFTVATYRPSSTITLTRAKAAQFLVEGCAIRIWTVASISPTSTVGMKLNIGDSVIVYGLANITNFKAIRDTACAVDGSIQVMYSR